MFNLPDFFNRMTVEAPLKFAGVDLRSNFGQYLPGQQNFWTAIQCFQVASLAGSHESFCGMNRHEEPGIAKEFGSPTPASDKYLLHQAPTEAVTRPVPVLLVHGAAVNANAWSVEFDESGSGLARTLTAAGFRVFGITFSHPHGDNLIQARQLADAVSQILNLTGSDKLDLVCHSKGGIAARCWLQGMIEPPKRNPVRKMLLMGVPNLGTDQAFRHPLMGFISQIAGLNSVIPYDRMYNMGMLMDTRAESIYSDGTFIGQGQILHPWADQIPLDPLEPDAEIVYEGGWGVFGHSRGIRQAIQDGGNLIERLNSAPFPAKVQVALLAGTNQMFGTIPTEVSAPSDGMIFVASASHTRPFTEAGVRSLSVDTLPVNHLELLYDPRVSRWAIEKLQAE